MYIATPTPDGDLHPSEMQFSYKEIRAAAKAIGLQAAFDEPFSTIDVGAEFTLWLYDHRMGEAVTDDTESAGALRVKVTGGIRFDPANFPGGPIDEVFKVFEATLLRRTISHTFVTSLCGLLYANTKKRAIVFNATDSVFVRQLSWETSDVGSNG